jgi:two-component system, OmpR family, sensor histidine kinase AdeS
MLITVRRWWRTRKRWPLTRQISMVFAVAMFVNGLLVSAGLDYYFAGKAQAVVASLSPAAQRAYRNVEAGRAADSKDLAALSAEIAPLNDRLKIESDAVFYVLIAIAALMTFALGYVFVGRLGRGLSDVGDAARMIAQGDLSARARPVQFASREEVQLTRDFNAMAVALQHADLELKDSTAAIAHELRTPLTILGGRLHGIEDGVFDASPEHIRSLILQVDGLGRLVEDLRTLSLANSGKLTLNLAAIDLAEEVRHVIATLHPDLDAAGLDTVLDLEPAPFIGDGPRLRQAIGAVLANAQRYAAHSGVLRIETHSGRDYIVVRVLDSGPGLSAEASSRAFERFWRGEQSRARHYGGSGLGLSVVRAIADAHGGTVALTDRESGGAAFEMILPHDPALLHAICTND